MLIAGQRGAVGDVHGLLAVALEHHVRLGDGVGFGLDFLSEQMDGYLLAVFHSNPVQPILRHCQHTARAACTIIAGIGGILDLIRNGRKHKVCHQFHNVTGRPVLTGFLIVCLVETTDKFLEDRTHGMVIQTRKVAVLLRAEIDVFADELLDNRAENIGFDHGVHLIAELELVQNLLHVGRKPVEIRLKIRLELLRGWAAGQIAQAERRRIAESLTGNIAKRTPLVGNPRSIQRLFHFEHLQLGVFQHSIQTADNRHRKNNIAVLTAHINIAQAIIGDTPDEIGDCIEHMGVHYYILLSL